MLTIPIFSFEQLGPGTPSYLEVWSTLFAFELAFWVSCLQSVHSIQKQNFLRVIVYMIIMTNVIKGHIR